MSKYGPAPKRVPISETLDLLEQAAASRSRCPDSIDIKNYLVDRFGRNAVITNKITKVLSELGHIRIEIYGRNWRVIEIMRGPHKGARTMGPPHGGKPHKVIGPRSGLDA